MLSKKNHQLQAQKLEAKQQHFAIKKLTVGVASVLISSTFAMYAGLHTAMADETTRPQATNTASETTATENETAKPKVVLKATTSSEDKTQTATAKSSSALTTTSTDKAESAVGPAKADNVTSTVGSSSALTTASTDKAESAVGPAKADNVTSTVGSSSALTTASTDKAESAVGPAKVDNVTSTVGSSSALTTAVGEESTAKPMNDLVSRSKEVNSDEKQNTQSLVPSATVDPDETPTSPQWQANASKALANKSGLYTPQLSYNRKWYSMTVDPAMLTSEVMKGNVIPFTATMHQSTGTMIVSSDYKLRLQLDARLADKVSSVSLSPASNENEVVYFKRVLGSDGQPSNIWESNVVYAQGGLYGGTPLDSGKPLLAKNGKITLKDTLENIYPKLPDITNEPLGYNGYIYDASSRTALLATNNEGYVVGPNDPLVKIPVTSALRSKFIGAHSNVNYDPTVGENGALVVYYQAQKSSMWAYQNDWQFQLHYAIDPVLLPYLEKKNGAYTVELDKAVSVMGLDDGSYGFEAITNNFLNNLYKPLSYRSKLMKKVADLPLNLDGTGTLNPSNLKDFVEFNDGFFVHGRPVMVRLVYRLNKKLNDIYAEMLKNGMTGNNLLFSHYYSDSTGKMQNQSLATSVLSFNDSDGDTLPNLKEESDSTNPYVSMPNVSDTYVSEKKVHGQLVFSNVERNPQVVKVVDDSGNVLGDTEVRPETFTTLAKAVPFEVTLKQPTLTAGKKVTVQVSSKLNHSEDTVENAVPQRTVVQIKKGPQAVKGLTYPLNAVFLQEPKALIANTAELPADATYALIKKPDLSTNGTKNAVVKVSFLDQYDKNYNHEIEVQVPVKVEGVNLKDGEFTLKPLVMHVNEVNDDLRPLPVEELESWHETDGTKTLNGQSLRSLVKSVTWSQSPSTKKAGQARGVVTVTTKDDKTMLANVPVNIVGATARADLKTPWGTELLAKDAVADTTALAQFDKADSPVTYKWKEPLNVTPTATADHVMHNAVVVTYGDKTTQEVPVSVSVGPSQASKFTVAPAKVEVHYGQTVDPGVSLTPEQKTHFNVSQVTLEQPVVTTKLGQVNANGQVVFKDGSTASVEVPVVVVGATAKNDVTTAWNVLPTPQTLVSNVSSLAKYTPTYTWNKRPNVSPTKEESHVVSGVVDVTYPDKVVQHLPATLTVLASQAERFDNATDKQVLPVVVAYGATELDAMHALEPETKTNFSVTQATFTTPVDTATVGTKEVPATLTFADTSTTTLPVQVEVLGANVASKVETAWGKLPTAKDMVTNADELEQFGASYGWKNAPVVTPGAGEDHQVTGTLLVTYHNGATQTLPVSLTVKPSEGERFANDQDVHLNEVSVNYGAKVPADKADNALTTEEKTNSKVTALVFKQDVDTLTAGEKLYPVQLSFNDGSKLDSQVLVKVVGAVAKQALTTPWGRNVAAKDLVANTSELDRFGTQEHPVTYQWVTDPDVTPEPEQTHTVTGTVTVTYGDGATQQLPVSFTVEPSDAEKATNELKNSNVAFTVNYGAKVDPTQALTAYSTEIKNKTKLTTAKFAGAVETTELGMNAHPVTLTFADGSTLAVELPVKVVGAQVDPTRKTAWGKVPDPSTVVTDLTELAKFDPKYTWKVQPVTTPLPDQDHHVQGTLQVEFADGATQTVPVELDVAPSMAEAAKDLQMQLVVEDLKASVPATDALKGLTEQDRQVYSVTQALFDHPVETNEVGVKSYEATLTFADGSTAKLPVQVKVVSQAENLAPVAKEGLNVSLGETLAPTDVLTPAVVLPKDTQLSWKTPVDTTKAGHQMGELEVTYPDGSKDVVEVPVKVGTDAEAMTPTVRPDLGVAMNGELTLTDVLNSDLPKDTQLSWKTPVNTTKAGHQTGELEVTYPDGSKDVVEVPVKVGTDAEAMTPTVRPGLGVAMNGELAPTDVLSSELPKDTQLSWKTPVDTTKAGYQMGELEVTYPDGSKDVVEVPVKVGTDAEAMTPTVRPGLGVAMNGELAPTDVLSSELPKDTQLSWKTPVDTTKAGYQMGELEVTYPDGSKDVVEVPVKVGTDAEAMTPTVRPAVEVALNGELNPTDVLSSDLPKDTQLSWKMPVNTTKAGHQTGELEVTYPDGSKDVVKVPVKVGTDAEAMTPTVRPAVEVALNGELNPTDVLSSDLPKDTQLSWKMPVNTTKAGHQTGELEVTYPDGSKDVVKVPVKVGTDAEAMTPTVRPAVEVALNSELKPADVLSSDLPKDTQLSWKTPVDTSKASHQTGELEVTYPDDSKDVVEVPVKVGTDAEAMTPTVRPDLGVAMNGELTLTDVLNSDLPKDTQLSWKTPVNTTKAGHQTGELEVTYPDGSKDVVEVPVKVGTDAEALTPTVRPDLGVALNGELKPTDVLNSKLPKDTELSWKTPVDTTKAGRQTGELEVTYPDGSKDVVEVPVKVGTDAEAMTPAVRPDFGVALNGELAPTDVLNSDLPKDTQLSWKTPVNTTKAGHQTGELEVTYPDGSKDVVEVPVKVGTDAEAMTPTVRPDLGVAMNGELTLTDVLNSDLPKDTQLSWKTPVNTTKAGHQTGELEVTYPDGSKDVVEVPVKVGTDAEALTPTVRLGLEVELNGELAPTDVLSSDLPKDTELSWKTPVDTTKAGHQTGELEVTYPDGSKDVVEVPVKVGTDAEAMTPTVRPDLGVALNGELAPTDVLNSDLPKDTQLSWKTPVNTTKAGHQTGELEVTYPDGSKDVVEVPVKVGTDAEAMTPTVRPDLGVAMNGELTLTDVLNSDLPKDTQLSWKTPVDTTKAGHQMGELEVTYPDGSKEVVEVPVKVGTDAEALTPTVRSGLEVALNGELAPTDVLNSELPKDTQLSWKTPVDTTKAGHQTGELEVTYPDGSKDVVKVTVEVVEPPKETPVTKPVSESVDPQVKNNLQVGLGETLEPTKVLDGKTLPTGTRLSWKTPVDTTKAGHQTGELEVTYPDGSKDVVKVTVEVVEPPKETPVTKPVSESVDPQVKNNLQVGLGETLEPTKVLDGKTLPTGTRLSWKTPVDTTKAGHQTGELEVTYPDGSKDVVKVTVEVVEPPKETPVTKPVSESVDPQVKNNLQVGLGETLEPTKVLDGKTLPTGTRLSWKTPVDTTKAGYQAGELEVTYPDGSKDLVKVLVKVGTDADMYTPVGKLGVMVSLNAKVAPQQFLDTDRFPKDTQFTFEKDFDTTNSGEQKNMLKVVYPDGSYDEVVVSVKVYSEADLFTPKMRAALKVTKGTSLALDDLFDEGLPTDAQVKWLVLVDTNRVGTQTGKLEVSYRDGSKDMLNVVVDVVEDDQAQRLTDVFHVNGPKEGSAVNNWKKVTGKQHTAGAKKHKEVLPQTGEHEHESTTLLGMMLLMLLGTFKFGYKKKH